ncbi:MAG: hypothetical protein EPO51_16055 [Phenylobacterium sp.]|uniref:hypothetical protein n=1 Tax=Phenylobacterium sp. TaxID=1871053 RepID=UPI001211D698|nr:hypothetical protein [Phenylobacterium sp.]TAJ71020.1 MAG: hypothetical protein EPO51_16055 [Phenylobacterium sp.]
MMGERRVDQAKLFYEFSLVEAATFVTLDRRARSPCSATGGDSYGGKITHAAARWLGRQRGQRLGKVITQDAENWGRAA